MYQYTNEIRNNQPDMDVLKDYLTPVQHLSRGYLYIHLFILIFWSSSDQRVLFRMKRR